MKIRFNNFLNLKTKEKKRINVKEPVLKVYSGGKIIKYEAYKNEKAMRRRKGAENVCDSFDFDGSKHNAIVEKYKENNGEEQKVKPKKRKKNKNKSAYSLFLFMLILAGCSLYFSYSRYKELNNEDYAVYNSEDLEESVSVPVEQSSVSNNLDTKVVEEAIKTSTNISNNTAKTKVQKVTPLNFAKPLEGEILKIYSKDKVIYSKTLELWKTHDGIDIKADENAIVKAIEKGTVEKIYDDSFYGKTIVIDHGQGYKSSYSNLSEEIFVKEKQVVTKLAKIGKIGKTAIGEIKDESHLHFMLIKNNEICDPSSIFN